jgi:hypothetical protein
MSRQHSQGMVFATGEPRRNIPGANPRVAQNLAFRLGRELYEPPFGLMITWAKDGGVGNEAESLIYSPHGLYVKQVESIAQANPKIKTSAMLYTTKEIYSWLYGYATLGSFRGLNTMRELKARYWIPTHDEEVSSTGFMAWSGMMKVRWITLEEAFTHEENEIGEKREQGFEFAVVGNRESFILA